MAACITSTLSFRQVSPVDLNVDVEHGLRRTSEVTKEKVFIFGLDYRFIDALQYDQSEDTSMNLKTMMGETANRGRSLMRGK